MIIKGKVWKFKDNIDTDVIIISLGGLKKYVKEEIKRREVDV
ncbi:hypothetical protein ES708_00941 [subsurface metagenome]